MTFLEAAEQVLLKENRPLQVKEIVELALRYGYLATNGKTPQNTLHVALGSHLKKCTQRKVHPDFEKIRLSRRKVLWKLAK